MNRGRIWVGGREGRTGLLNLEYKCLMDIDSENCIIMHDQLRDLGRDLAEKKRASRVWDSSVASS